MFCLFVLGAKIKADPRGSSSVAAVFEKKEKVSEQTGHKQEKKQNKEYPSWDVGGLRVVTIIRVCFIDS